MIEDAVVPSNGERDLELKPWMLKAIVEGVYSPEHVAILEAQRRKVKETIKISELGFREYSVTQRFQQMLYAAAQSSTATLDRHSSDTPSKMFPECTYRACSCCRYVFVSMS